MLIFFWNAPSLILAATTGSYTLNGRSVTFVIDPLVPAYGTYAYTGQAVSFRFGASMLVRNATGYSVLIDTPASNTTLIDTPDQLDG